VPGSEERQARAELSTEGVATALLVVDGVEQAELRGQPERLARRVVEAERRARLTFDGVGAVEIELQLAGQSQIELEVGRDDAPRPTAAHDAALEVELADTGRFEGQIGRLEVTSRVRSTQGGCSRQQARQQGNLPSAPARIVLKSAA
jgi:hypothetical protein